MKTPGKLASIVVLAFVVTGCGDGTSDSQPVALGAPETFTWVGGQPVSFAVPPAGWERDRYQNGGTEGVSFVKAGSGGEMIFVTEWFFVGRRDRCAHLGEIRRDLDSYDRMKFNQAITKARLYAAEPFNAGEARMTDTVNATLDRARQAYSSKDLGTTRIELGRAIEQAGQIRFTVAETVDRALFTAEKNRVFPGLQVAEPRPDRVAGEEALTVDFAFKGSTGPMVGRRTYVAKNNRLFELGFQGLETNLAMFEEIVASLEFPQGTCRH